MKKFLDDIISYISQKFEKELQGYSIKEYQTETNCSILLITHNPKLLDILKPDYIHILKDKKIIKTGDASLAQEIEKKGFKELSN